jgi:hypothetical protein
MGVVTGSRCATVRLPGSAIVQERTMTTTQPHPTATSARRHHGAAERRVGHVVAVLLDAFLLHLVNVSPGWSAVPFLTDAFPEVLGVVNASIVSGLVVHLVCVVRDPAWLRALGDVVTTAMGLAALWAIWQVWPVALDTGWELLARWVVAVGVLGSVAGIVAAVVRFVRALSASPCAPGEPLAGGGTTRRA